MVHEECEVWKKDNPSPHTNVRRSFFFHFLPACLNRNKVYAPLIATNEFHFYP